MIRSRFGGCRGHVVPLCPPPPSTRAIGSGTGTETGGPNYRIGPGCAGRAQLQQLFVSIYISTTL